MRIRRLEPTDAAAYRALMLQSYANEPIAFTATVAERQSFPLSWWVDRLSGGDEPNRVVFGAMVDDELVGAAGLDFERRPRTRHKAKLFAMTVLPAHRKQGIARRLVDEIVEHASAISHVRAIQLTVSEPNESARRFYESCGFETFGTEPFALRHDDPCGERFLAKVHMWRELRRRPP